MEDQHTNDPHKALKYLWDFIFGVLLIGGAPWSVNALVIVITDLLEKYAQIFIPHMVGMVLFFVLQLVALGALIAAAIYRYQKRMLPKGFIVAEIILGLVGAVLLVRVFGVIVRFIID